MVALFCDIFMCPYNATTSERPSEPRTKGAKTPRLSRGIFAPLHLNPRGGRQTGRYQGGLVPLFLPSFAALPGGFLARGGAGRAGGLRRSGRGFSAMLPATGSRRKDPPRKPGMRPATSANAASIPSDLSSGSIASEHAVYQVEVGPRISRSREHPGQGLDAPLTVVAVPVFSTKARRGKHYVGHLQNVRSGRNPGPRGTGAWRAPP